VKSEAVRSKTGESCPSLESRTWKPAAVFRASTQSDCPELLLRVLFLQDRRHSTHSALEALLLRELFRQLVNSAIEKPSDPDCVIQHDAREPIIQGDFLLFDDVAGLVQRFDIDERGARTGPATRAEDAERVC
jgi:hypothetical protein